MGQFTQPDPVANYLNDPQKLKQATGQDLQKYLENPQALNNYSYTQNNPVRYVDPRGETIIDVIRGKQTLPAYQLEIGNGAEILYNNGGTWKNVMDHPVLTGAVTGLMAGLGVIFAGIVAGTAPWQVAVSGATATVIAVPALDVAQEFDKLSSESSEAYQIAQAGGKNFDMIQNAVKNNMTAQQVQSSITSLEKNAMEHLGRIKDPSTYSNYQQFLSKTPQEQLYTLQNWEKQAKSFLEQANVWKGYLSNLIDKS